MIPSIDGWSEDAAEERWLDDLEGEVTAAELSRARLTEPPLTAAPRERAYRAAAKRWLDRGRPWVALALLDRATLAPLAPPALAGDPRADLPVDALMARTPGTGGLPALTEAEAAALRSAATPEDAVRVIRGARRRLHEHGQEARRLLRRWVERRG